MGKVVHFEVPVDDAKRAQDFYSKAFGWKIVAVPNMDYWLVQTALTDKNGMLMEIGAINGGMTKRGEPVGSPVITIDVEDIDRALERIAELGGEAMGRKMPVGDMGFSAYFKDSEGNVMGLWQNAWQTSQ